MREVDARSARVGQGSPGKLVARLREHGLAMIAMNPAQSRPSVVLWACAVCARDEPVGPDHSSLRRFNRDVPSRVAAGARVPTRVAGVHVERKQIRRTHWAIIAAGWQGKAGRRQEDGTKAGRQSARRPQRVAWAMKASISAAGLAPVVRAASRPPEKTASVGIERMPWRAPRSLSASVFTLTTR